MRSFVITIMNNPKSVHSANRCIASAPNLKIQYFKGITPDDDTISILNENNINDLNNFKIDQKFSRMERCIAAFLSHLHLWKKSVELNENVIIFEHDAIVTGNIPKNLNFDKVMTLSKPSYGNYITPSYLGVGPLIQKRYFGGAHGYIVSPLGAKELLKKAETDAGPTDVFLHLNNFSFLQEYYPWVVEAKDSFTTIQNEKGCRAKHMYHINPKNYRII